MAIRNYWFFENVELFMNGSPEFNFRPKFLYLFSESILNPMILMHNRFRKRFLVIFSQKILLGFIYALLSAGQASTKLHRLQIFNFFFSTGTTLVSQYV